MGNKISEKVINRNLKYSQRQDKDRIYLMYDIDVEGFHDKLIDIKKKTGSELLLSNPCFELWYILHYYNQSSEISTDNCVKKIESLCPDYTKGAIPSKLKEKLEIKCIDAIKKAKNLETHKNPSTNIYLFVEELERIKNG